MQQLTNNEDAAHGAASLSSYFAAPLMLPTEVPCSVIFASTFWPKILKPAIAISATTPTRMMYSTMLAPRVSFQRFFFAMRFSFDFMGCSFLYRLSGEWGGDHATDGLIIRDQRGADRNECGHDHQSNSTNEDDVFDRRDASGIRPQFPGRPHVTEGRSINARLATLFFAFLPCVTRAGASASVGMGASLDTARRKDSVQSGSAMTRPGRPCTLITFCSVRRGEPVRGRQAPWGARTSDRRGRSRRGYRLRSSRRGSAV